MVLSCVNTLLYAFIRIFALQYYSSFLQLILNISEMAVTSLVLRINPVNYRQNVGQGVKRNQ